MEKFGFILDGVSLKVMILLVSFVGILFWVA